MYFQVIKITVTPPSDFSVLKTFLTKKIIYENRTQCWLWNSYLHFNAKQM